MKKIKISLFAVATVAFAWASCNNPSEYNKDEDDTDTTSIYENEDRKMSTAQNQEFVREVASDGMMEVRMAEIALNKSDNNEVKELARMIRDDHQEANRKLKDIALNNNWEVPNDLLAGHQQKVDNLSNLSGAEFNRQFIQINIEAHQKAIDKFERAVNGETTVRDDNMNRVTNNNINNSDAMDRTTNTERNTDADMTDTNRSIDDPQLREWVNSTLPALRKHLEHCQKLQGRL